jgi:hypothetical protein
LIALNSNRFAVPMLGQPEDLMACRDQIGLI